MQGLGNRAGPTLHVTTGPTEFSSTWWGVADDKETCHNCGKDLPANWKDNFCQGGKCAKEYAKKHSKKRKSADWAVIASRVAASTHESLERPSIEYSARTEIAFSAEFEGKVDKDVLIKKLQTELISALEASVKIVSRELRLRPGRILVKPLRLEVAINDQASYEEGTEDEQGD